MTPESTVPTSDFQRFASEQAIALARELEKTEELSPDGQVLGQLEGVMLSRGRETLLAMLERKIQDTADEVVKKGGAHGPVPAAIPRVTKVRRRGPS